MAPPFLISTIPPFFQSLFSAMGRKASTKEQKQVKKRQWNQKYVSDPSKLAKKRENDRLKQQERRQRARLASLTLLADIAAQAPIIIIESDNEESEDDGSIKLMIMLTVDDHLSARPEDEEPMRSVGSDDSWTRVVVRNRKKLSENQIGCRSIAVIYGFNQGSACH